jgi:hypothetical protein
VHAVFRKKTTRGQVISAELQEGFSHLGTAVTEAGRAAAEQLGPRVEAARVAATPALEAAQLAVAPKVAAAVAAAAPVVTSARENLAPRVEAALESLGPRVEAARGAAGPRVSSAVTSAQAAAVKAAADLAPRVAAARETLEKDVVPKLGAAQAAAVAYAAPRVHAAREAVGPVLENARESLSAGVETALSELEAVREELAGSAAKAGKKARKTTAKQRRQLEKKAAKTAAKVKRKVGVEPEPRRWPWLLAVLAVGAATFAILRRLKGSHNSWTPAPAGDGPVPSYREDPVPSTPSDSAKTVSTAETTPGDATPPDTDLGEQPQQMAYGDAENSATPGTATTSPNDPALDTATAAPDDLPQQAPDATGVEGSGQLHPPGTATGGTGTERKGEPLNPQDPA